jgi:tRNA U34 2-thiouridine synthase MnmA/TrmU
MIYDTISLQWEVIAVELNAVAYLIAIIALVLVMNLFFLVRMRRRGSSKPVGRRAVDEAKQAAWREKEVQRRIDREQDDAFAIVQLRNETLAVYEEVRQLAIIREKLGIERVPGQRLKDFIKSDEQTETVEVKDVDRAPNERMEIFDGVHRYTATREGGGIEREEVELDKKR